MPIIAEQSHFHDLKNILDYGGLRDVPRRGIVHVGADVGQEVEQYLAYGFAKIILVEANPEPYRTLVVKFGADPRITIFNCAICDCEGWIDFHLHTSRSGSTEPASLLAMKRFREIVKTLHTAATIRVFATTLDALFAANGLDPAGYNFLNLDIQGAELLALQGASGVLRTMDAVISEVALIELYEGAPLEPDIVRFLEQHGFDKKLAVYHTLYDNNSTFPAWGECLFIKRR
jgi:FkbM family methyltransferase